MKKKIGIIVLIVIILSIAGVMYYFRNGQRTQIITSDLTERSIEHMERQKRDNDDQLWRNVEFESKRPSAEEIASQIIKKESCYEFSFPFNIASEHPSEGCVKSIAIENPNGRVVVNYKDVSASTLDAVPDVLLRRNKSDQYEEKPFNNTRYSFLTFKKQGSTYEKSAFYLSNGKVVSISLTASTNEDLDAKFDILLQSFTLL